MFRWDAALMMPGRSKNWTGSGIAMNSNFSPGMNILFALYGDFSSNSANPLLLYARELHSLGHSCAVAIPFGLETICQHENPKFRPILFSETLAAPDAVFPDGRPADVIHACTPREIIRRFVTSYM